MESRHLLNKSTNKEIQEGKRRREPVSDRGENLKRLRREYGNLAEMTRERDRQETEILAGVSSQRERTKEAISYISSDVGRFNRFLHQLLESATDFYGKAEIQGHRDTVKNFESQDRTAVRDALSNIPMREKFIERLLTNPNENIVKMTQGLLKMEAQYQQEKEVIYVNLLDQQGSLDLEIKGMPQEMVKVIAEMRSHARVNIKRGLSVSNAAHWTRAANYMDKIISECDNIGSAYKANALSNIDKLGEEEKSHVTSITLTQALENLRSLSKEELRNSVKLEDFFTDFDQYKKGSN